VPGAPHAGAWRTKRSILTTNYEPKSPSRRTGDQSDEKLVIVRGAHEDFDTGHGASSDQMSAAPWRSGFATAERRTVRAGRELIEVKWMTITDAGRQALDG
jgi:hypothetical protein